MRSASSEPPSIAGSSFAQEPSGRRRAIGLVLAIVANILLLLLLLNLAPSMSFVAMRRHAPLSFQLLPEPASQSAGGRKAAQAKRPSSASRQRTTTRTPPPPPPVTPPPLPQPEQPLHDMLVLSKEDYAASDVAKLPSHKGEQSASAGNEGAGAGSGSSNSTGAGTGPGGEPLYAAEWYREPTQAELSTYLPRAAGPGSWGEVACRTVARFRVEDCQELADTPGSHLARAVREASFQFLVRPPRVGGRLMVGSWVRIRITITPGGIEHN